MLIGNAVCTQRCCKSLQVRSGRTDNTNAKTPAALGAAADVPPCRSEQLFSPTSVVCCLFVLYHHKKKN